MAHNLKHFFLKHFNGHNATSKKICLISPKNLTVWSLTSTAGVHKKEIGLNYQNQFVMKSPFLHVKTHICNLHQEKRCPKVTLLNGLVSSKDLPGGTSYKTSEAEIVDKKTPVVCVAT